MTATATLSTAPQVDGTETKEPVDAYTVGWEFVQQYYTFLNKDPAKLHRFYNKKSTFTFGSECEVVKTKHGQQEIHQRILELGFHDCQVKISNIDSQLSNAGVLVHVLGEMSNRGEASHKFAQTFFLAEQTHGYYVLNDIFRFLKEEVEMEYDEGNPTYADGDDAHHQTHEQATNQYGMTSPLPRAGGLSPAPPPMMARAPSPTRTAQPAPQANHGNTHGNAMSHAADHHAAEEVYQVEPENWEPTAAIKEVKQSPAQPIAIVREAPAVSHPIAPVATAPVVATSSVPSPSAVSAPAVVPPVAIVSPVVPSPVASPQQKPHVPHTTASHVSTIATSHISVQTSPEQPQRGAAPVSQQPTPIQLTQPSSTQAAPPAQQPTPPPNVAKAPVKNEPAKPKTWATLAATPAALPAVTSPTRAQGAPSGSVNGTRPGSPVAQAPPPPPQQQQQQQQQQKQPARPQSRESATDQRRSVSSGTENGKKFPVATVENEKNSIYVKNVIPTITKDIIRDTFSKVGVIKHMDVVPTKGIAFVEFATPESVKKAVEQNLFSTRGTDGQMVNMIAERRRPYPIYPQQNQARSTNGNDGSHQQQQSGSSSRQLQQPQQQQQQQPQKAVSGSVGGQNQGQGQQNKAPKSKKSGNA
ncbi:hypothetical protein SmJEL517_g01122 [Synchytrium microbalum]|uniref:NTF2 domain-containing protein n=1 Tax=Synchytrium microbalum TaxID=1806994 RepID=A0A507C6I6_9FUNG|nr:uncharacterized protein SmJEL517_g01122 [Synchytrium microbalum]TPX37200.1 hypothetical protein SmJEL517_g01122 [Synchytrium microbalum]